MADRYYTTEYTSDKQMLWKNFPDTATPLSAQNLQKAHSAIGDIDNTLRAAFNNVDRDKLDKSDAANMISSVEYNSSNGTLVFHYYSSSIQDLVLNLNLQKIVVNFAYDSATQRLLLTQSDGTVVPVDLSAFVANPDLANSNTIAWTVSANGTISADIIDGSVTDAKIESHYLASIASIGGQVEQDAAMAEYYAKLSKSYANGTSNLPDRPTEIIDNARYYMEQAQQSEVACGSILNIAGERVEDAEAWAKGTRDGQPIPNTDPAYNNSAKYWAEQASEIVNVHPMEGATATTDGKGGLTPKPLAGQQNDLLTGGAQYKSLDALGIQKQVLASALTIGGQVVTEVEEALNALNENSGGTDDYTDLQNKPQINGNTLTGNKTGSQLGLQNTVLASSLTIGGQTITEVEPALRALNENSSAKDNFIGTKEQWEALTPQEQAKYNTMDFLGDEGSGGVSGVKGNAESNYRTGNVNLTPANLGALATNGDSESNTVTFTSSDDDTTTDKTYDGFTSVSTIASNETHSSLFNKISKMFLNIRKLWNTVGTTDISSVGQSVTGAVNNISNAIVFKTLSQKQLPAINANEYGWLDYTSEIPSGYTPIGISQMIYDYGYYSVYAWELSSTRIRVYFVNHSSSTVTPSADRKLALTIMFIKSDYIHELT